MTEQDIPDAEARRVIREEVDINVVVEAAAGTGKTTCLIGRLLTLFRRGALAGGSRLAAVTFTHKAAAELRQRMERELAAAIAAADGLPPAERDNLLAAGAVLGECHIGTIHSFCSRLIRERPVEAGVDPGFQELDDETDALLRRRAWEEFTAALAHGAHSDLRAVFETFDLDLESLYPGFERFADFPDIDAWPGNDAGTASIDAGDFADAVERYLGGLGPIRPKLADARPGNDDIIPALRLMERRLLRLARPVGLTEAYRLACIPKENHKGVQAAWAQFGLKKNEAKEEHAAYGAFVAGTVLPFRRQCRAAAYAAALRAFRLAGETYDRLRRARRLLNFQDLLLTAAAMLRDHPEARADLASRYARLLVDEVQDTDPVQAEIMFLLAAADPRETNWRDCRPRPGALFMVGDPKQSIYRFRRADIAVYQEMKRLVEERGGRSVGLVANFRSQPAVIDWVNRVFTRADADIGKTDAEMALSGRFPDRESRYSPAYTPLHAGTPAAADGCFSGVFSLKTLRADPKAGIRDDAILEDEAARIAAFIRHAVDGGLRLPGQAGGPRPARAGDFMIVPYGKKDTARYAAALRRLGLACLVSGETSLARSPAVGLLAGYLAALACPDDPVRLLAVLRGGLFGVADTELYRWKKAGGAFDFTLPPAAGSGRIAGIFTGMAGHAALFRRLQPAAAAGRMAEDLGLWAHACLGDDPSSGAGIVAAALELLRAEAGELTSLAKLAERLLWRSEHYEDDIPPARPAPADAVRVMNLHKTKGLEAPVVFLTSTRKMRPERPAAFAVVRKGRTAIGTMAISGGEFGNIRLAEPGDWEGRAEEEERFLAAERTRLRYVAATRAGAALVVSVHQTSGSWKSRFLADDSRPGVAIPSPLPEPARGLVPGQIAADAKPARLDTDVLAAAAKARGDRRPALLTASYDTLRAKPSAPSAAVRPAARGEPASDDAMNLGEVLHRLLTAGGGGDLEARAAELLREYDLPLSEAAAAAEMVRQARASALWRRAARAERVFREAPFTWSPPEEGGRNVQRGVIDLVFREAGGWVVVDYKSDRLPAGTDPVRAAERHAGQLSAYRRAWSGITGEAVTETGIYFLRAGEYARVETGVSQNDG